MTLYPNDYGQVSDTPAGTGYTAVAAGRWHSLALKADGSIVSWGRDREGQVSQTPAGTGYTAIAGGYVHNLALKADGSIVSWGDDKFDQVSQTPAGTGFTAIAAGVNFSLALRADGSIASWGEDDSGQVSQTPAGTGYTAVAAGASYSLALRADGSIASWGRDVEGQVSQTPAGTGYTAIAAGNSHSLALRADGSIASWGYDQFGQVSKTPAGTGYTAIAAGSVHSLALTADGSIVSWGDDLGGVVSQTPAGTGYTAVADGRYHSLALRALVPGFTASPVNGFNPLTVQFTDTSTGTPISWSWDFGDGQASSARNPAHAYSDPGVYSVSLTVTYLGIGSTSVTKTNFIRVFPSLVPGFTASLRTGYDPLTVQFTDTSAGGPTSWNWSFGDGQFSTAQNPLHTYTGDGLYTVRLTVSSLFQSDKTATMTDYIRVLPLYHGLIRVEAEDYNVGGEGVAYHDTTPGNSGGAYRQDDVDIAAFATRGYFVTSIAEGEWTRYPVWSGAAENYNYPLSLRLAGLAGGQTVTVTVAGMAGEIDIPVPNTGSVTTFAFANATLRLKPGLNMVQFTYHGKAMNFDYFTLDPPAIPAPPAPFPGMDSPPLDLDADGLYDDVNGNGRPDFADVVLYFNQMSWIAANEPVSAFDYNGNGRIDFADVVWLFNNL